jgi:hypothetical protein
MNNLFVLHLVFACSTILLLPFLQESYNLTIIIVTSLYFVLHRILIGEEPPIYRDLVKYVVIYSIFSIVFGAPLRMYQEILTWSIFTSVVSTLNPDHLFVVFVGNWVGVFVVPLDWDTPWQVWPIPSTICCIIALFLRDLFSLRWF